MKRFAGALACLACLLLASACAQPQRLQLPSGVQLIVERIPNAPLVALEVWIRAGVADETPETSGAAHLLEHLIFKGTTDLPPGALDEAFEQAGGVLDAFTERDWTRYCASVLPDRWQKPLQTLLRCLLQPALPADALDNERRLILNDEYALHAADPIRPMRYALFAQAFPNHPYGMPLLGNPDTLARLDIEAVRRFHQAHYRPERIVVVVVGAVELQAVRGIVEAAVSGNAPHPQPRSREAWEKRDSSHTTQEKASEDAGVSFYFPTPPVREVNSWLCAEVQRTALAEPYRGMMYEGDEPLPFGRLHSEYLPRVLGSLIAFFALPPAEPTPNWREQTRARYQSALQQIAEGKARPALEQARTLAVARHEATMRDFRERARWYGLCATLGLHLTPEAFAAQLRSLPLEQVEAFARREQSATPAPSVAWTVVSKQGTDRTVRATGMGGTPVLQVAWTVVSKQGAGETPVLQVAWTVVSKQGTDRTVRATRCGLGFQPKHIASASRQRRTDRTVRATGTGETPVLQVAWTVMSKPASTDRTVRATRQRFSNGLRVLALAAPNAEQVVVQVAIAHRGAPPDAAAGELTARMLFGATQNETERTLAARIARSGGSLRIEWTPAGALITAYARRDSVVNILALLKEALFRAEFTPTALQRAARQALYDRQHYEGAQSWRLIAQRSGLYADETALKQVTLDAVRRYYRAHYRPENAVIAIAGDFSPEQLTEWARQFFGGEWDIPPAPRTPTPERAERLELAILTDPRGLTYTGYLWQTPTPSPADYYALLACQTLLGEGKRARLFVYAREQQGVGYAIRAETYLLQNSILGIGWIQAGKSPAPETVLRRALSAPVQPEEYARAVALLRGEWERLRLNLAAFTAALAWAEHSGLGYEALWNAPEYIAALSHEAVETARRRLLRPLGVQLE
ncbi:MAG: insulinase family protein [Fimbriimonadales bacterium]|nr:insulinase family protein [Fimbriimonadales bacterium]